MAMAVQVPLYTVDELQQFPSDGNRYELLDGVLLVTPAPAAVHQLVVARIQVRLAMQLQLPGLAHVVGPGAVVRKPRTQLEPDILVYPARYSPRTDWPRIREHWLAVEVLSKSSRIYDREFKRDAYLALGVGQVWLVDWHARVVEISSAPGALHREATVIEWQTSADVTVRIELAEVFAGL
jgi:Uma2 family endonuclease